MVDPSKTILVEVIAYAPTTFYHCQHCEFIWQQTEASAAFRQEQLDTSVPDDLKQDYQRLSDWVRNTVELYGDRVVFKVIDAASIEGVLKSVRYGVHHYPAIVVDGREKYIGSDFGRVKPLIDQRLAMLSV